MPTRPISLQKMELEGRLPFQNDNYSSQSHQKLVGELIKTRAAYPTQQIANRIAYAAQEHTAWNAYLADLVSQIPEVIYPLIEGRKNPGRQTAKSIRKLPAGQRTQPGTNGHEQDRQAILPPVERIPV